MLDPSISSVVWVIYLVIVGIVNPILFKKDKLTEKDKEENK